LEVFIKIVKAARPTLRRGYVNVKKCSKSVQVNAETSRSQVIMCTLPKEMGGKDGSTMKSTTRIFKPLLRGAIPLLVFAAVGQAAAQVPPPPPTTLPTTTAQCFNGGWQAFKVFKNQGDCVSFVATKGKNPPSIDSPPPPPPPPPAG
jgi:hypothetical protein